MSRLFDDIPQLKTMKVPVTVVEISNVSAYYGTTAKPEWDYLNDFPNAAPPFAHAFYEMREPPFVNIGGQMVKTVNGPDFRMGLLARAIDVDDPDLEFKLELMRYVYRDEPEIVTHQLAGSKWIHFIQATCRTSAGILHPAFWSVYGVNAEGKIHQSPNGFRCLFFEDFLRVIRNGHDFSVDGLSDSDVSGAFASGIIHPYLLAVSFMHCKNVKRVENVPPPKVQARRSKEGKLPLTKYYTLEIEAMKRTLQTEGGISTNGLKRALHICRGHFATYDEKPLFGKVKGTFWVPQHVKGSKAVGEIVKDYSVKGPKVTP